MKFNEVKDEGKQTFIFFLVFNFSKYDSEEIEILNESIVKLKEKRSSLREQIKLKDEIIDYQFSLFEKSKKVVEDLDTHITCENSVLTLFIDKIKIYENNKIEVMWRF